MQKKLVVTGGHATPALAVIEALRYKSDWKVDWIGEKKAAEGLNTKTLEATVLPKLGIPFHPIITPKFHRGNLLKTIFFVWKLPIGFVQSFILLLTLRPNIVLTFGSYIAFPVSLAAWLLGIPIIVHEQTAASGLANRIISLLAKKVAISFQVSSKYFPVGKTVLTGNPVRSSFFKIANKREKKNTSVKNPILYIVGGSRGSIAINDVVLQALHSILVKCDVIHVTGELDYKRVEEQRSNLIPRLKAKYKVSPLLTFDEVEVALEKSSFAIARAGANTVTEFGAIGMPAIFIPLPKADSDEQTKNASVLVNTGSSILLPQPNLTKNTLLQAIDNMLRNLDQFTKKAMEAKKIVNKDAAIKIADLVEDSL